MELRWPCRVLGVAIVIAACHDPVSTATDESNLDDKSDPFTLEEQALAVKQRDEDRAKAYNPVLREQTPPSHWIAYAYHGLVLDGNFEEIAFDPEVVDAIHTSIFEQLQPKLADAAIAKYGSDLTKLFAADGLNPRERAEARQTAIEGLIALGDEITVEDLGWRIDVLRGAMVQIPWQYTISQAALDWIRSHGIIRWTPPPGRDYITACAREGVPIPPDWPDDQWGEPRGTLTFNFIGGDATVYTYTDPSKPEHDGICYALPRLYSDGRFLVGVICQSNVTGKACFWDNIDRDTGRRLTTGEPVRIGYVKDGYTLHENCTGCHRGDNVFNIHPGTALEIPDAGWTSPRVRYSALGRDVFVNPPPITLPAPPDGQLSCTGCHGLPRTSSQYCESVLRPAAEQTMPRNLGEAGWVPARWPLPDITRVRPDYVNHMSWLGLFCGLAIPAPDGR